MATTMNKKALFLVRLTAILIIVAAILLYVLLLSNIFFPVGIKGRYYLYNKGADGTFTKNPDVWIEFTDGENYIASDGKAGTYISANNAVTVTDDGQNIIFVASIDENDGNYLRISEPDKYYKRQSAIKGMVPKESQTKETWKKNAGEGLQVFVLGMATVFIVMATIWLIFEIIGFIMKRLSARNAAVDSMTVTTVESEPELPVTSENSDDGEIIAAITAAVSAVLEEESATLDSVLAAPKSSFRVVSYKKRF